jgi:invasion protein IalB
MARLLYAGAILAAALAAQSALAQTDAAPPKSHRREIPKPTDAPAPAPAVAQAPAAAPAPAPAPVSSDPQATTAAYGDWVVRCPRIGQGAAIQHLCEAAEIIQTQGAQGPIAQIAIGRLTAADPLRLTLVLPPNVSFPSTPRMSAEEKDPHPLDLNWRRCLPGGCFADVEIKDDVLQRWRALTSQGAILFKDSTGRDISVPFSFRGLGPALDALAKS